MFSIWWIHAFLLVLWLKAFTIFTVCSYLILILLFSYVANMFIVHGCETVGDFFGKRLGNVSCRYFIASASILLSVMVKLTLVIVIGNALLSSILEADAYSVLLLLIVTVGLYVVVGGFGAELYAQAIHSTTMMLVGIVATVLLVSWNWFNGIQALPAIFPEYIPLNNWSTVVTGVPFYALWSFLADGGAVQKVASAGSLRTLRKSVLITSVILAIVGIVLIGGGLVAQSFVVVQEGVSKLLSLYTNVTLLVVVAISIMGASATIFNSVAVSITYDFFKTIHQNSSGRTLVLVGRVTTIVVLVYTIIVMPFILLFAPSFYPNLLTMLFHCSAVLGAMLFSLFVVSTMTAKGILLGGVVGLTIALIRFVVVVIGSQGVKEYVAILINSGEGSLALFLLTFCVSFVTWSVQRKKTATSVHS
ncbi:MAG: hypothetical protein N3A63_04815 [Bacteroidetes bacterium]|nr:hypothetical protein [Bacteroidota bacterium]